MSYSNPNSKQIETRSCLVPEYKIARSKDELEGAFGLCFQSYLRAGLVIENPSGLRLTPFHLLPESEVLIGKAGDTVFSTMSLFCDGELGLPMDSIYPREIENLRSQGLRLAEVGSLADRRSSTRRYMESFIALGRLLSQAAVYRNIDALVVVCHPKHAKLYRRMMGFQQIGEYTECPYANGNPAVALVLEFETSSEPLKEQFLGTPLAPAELMPYQWPLETWKFFNQVLEMDGEIARVTNLKGFYPAPEARTPLNVLDSLPNTNHQSNILR